MLALDIRVDGSAALATAGRILLVVVLAFLVRALVHRSISRLVRRATEQTVPAMLRGASPLLSERRRQRAGTIGSALRSLSSTVVFAVAGTTVLSELDVDLGPILASAGIVGVAVGFGAQNVIKDWLNGMFMILEDQYGVGDVIDAGPASGTVEAVSLRTTRLRSVDGTVWHVRNGEVLRVGNMSQGWSRALLDVPVTWTSDVGQVREVIKGVADGLWRDEAWSARVLEEPEVWGVESMGSDGLVIRLVVKTAPLENWDVARELRARIKVAFEEAGIDIGVPTRAVRTVQPTAPKRARRRPPAD